MAESSGARVLLVELVVLPGSVELAVFMSVKLLSVELVVLLLGSVLLLAVFLLVVLVISSIGGIGDISVICRSICCIISCIGVISIIDGVCFIRRIDC